VALAVTAAGGAVYFGSSCDLAALQPVRQTDNSLVYGANGALIGVLPAVENRTAVVQAAISPWRATAPGEGSRGFGSSGRSDRGAPRTSRP